MDAVSAMEKYCNVCVHKEKCWRPCVIVIRALWDIEEAQHEPV
jgi:hypothetical protein